MEPAEVDAVVHATSQLEVENIQTVTRETIGDVEQDTNPMAEAGTDKNGKEAAREATSRPLTRAAKRRADDEARRGQEQIVAAVASVPVEASPVVSGDSPVAVSVGDRRRAAVNDGEGPAAKTTRKASKKSKTRSDSGASRPEGATDKHSQTPTSGQEQQEAALDDNDEPVPTYANETSLQLTDDEISEAQTHSKLVQTLLKAGKHQDMEDTQKYGLVLIKTPQGRRVILLLALWPKVFKSTMTRCGRAICEVPTLTQGSQRSIGGLECRRRYGGG
ncbi:hypothetical protein PR002_g7930 [Phytophthora rubi]|uniref:Uncharacterized protein n=1 Tax=Phytophthora rubi TaxID=129364 RepID=A0A6A3MZR0_9STRA|nr:hypothetical protein PR002_g7930 [Phytophthora rubi]